MGIGCFPVYDLDLPEAEYDGDGKGLAAEFENLDAIANQVGVTPLSEFCGGGANGVLEFVDEIPEGIEDMIESGSFYEPAEGLKSVRSLIVAIRENAAYFKMLHDAELTIEDLVELERCLLLAGQADGKFRLEMG